MVSFQYTYQYSLSKSIVRFGFLTDEQANPAKIYVPICNYNDEVGVVVKKYDERYCDVKAFQPTFNEYGMCFTFNNRKQGMDHFFQTNYAPSKTVKNDSDSFHIDPPEKFETAEKKMDSSEDVNQEILKVYQLY